MEKDKRVKVTRKEYERIVRSGQVLPGNFEIVEETEEKK